MPVDLTKLYTEVEKVFGLLNPAPFGGLRDPAGCAGSGPVIDENGHDKDND